MTTAGNYDSLRKPAVATIGMFDGVHLGHQAVIASLRAEAERKSLVPMVVTFSRHPRQVLHPDADVQLLMTPADKVAALEAAGADVVVMLDFDKALAAMTAREFIGFLHTRYNVRSLIVGYDHRFGHNRSEGFDDYVAYGAELGMEVIQTPEVPSELGHISSSVIRRLLLEGDVETANGMLSRRYSLTGTVVEGMHNGRRIGFPTANVDMENSTVLVPGNGVYAVSVMTPDGVRRRGMLNIGNRPTIGEGLQRTVEVNIFDFTGDLYGKRLRLELVALLRRERKMSGLAELQRQLLCDKEEIETILKQHNL